MLPSWVDEEMPFSGPCAICGGDDGRHRVTDAIVERVRARESVESVAQDFRLSEGFVYRLIVEDHRSGGRGR